MTTTQEATEGAGQGKQIEAEVRNATWDNVDPYGIQFGGNTAVDVRGKYSTYYFETIAKLNGWEPHDMLGYGDANTETMYGPVKFVVFINELATGAMGKLATFVA